MFLEDVRCKEYRILEKLGMSKSTYDDTLLDDINPHVVINFIDI